LGRALALTGAIGLLVSATLPAAALANSPTVPVASAPGHLVPVYAGHSVDTYRPIRAPNPALSVAGTNNTVAQTSTISVTYHGFSTKARAAFQAAVNVWQSIIVSDKVIHVNASWTDLGSASGILGQAGARNLYLENDGLWYPSALEEARCHCNADTGAEITAEFNSAFPYWYKGTDGNVPGNSWDLETVVLHELGHGLGFFSTFRVFSGAGQWGYQDNTSANHATRFDMNEWNQATGGARLTSYSNGVNPSSALKTQLTDGSVFLAGSHLQAVLGKRAKLYAPSPWQGGSSNSHLDETRFAPGAVNALMTPVLNNGEAIHDPGAATIAIFQDIGWTVAGSGDNHAPTVGMPVVNIVAPQVAKSTTNVRVSWPAATDPSGISRYELQRQDGAAPWVSVTLATPTSTSAIVPVTRGSNTAFRVRATDGASNTGAWAQTVSAQMLTVQQTPSANLVYAGAWASTSVSGSLGGSVLKSSSTDAKATFTFTGTSVALVAVRSASRGIAEVTLDGGAPQLVDLYAAAKKTKAVVWAPPARLAPGSHTVVVRVTGTKNASATGARVDVDAFLVWP
jgi:hypothetical protein